MTSSIDVAAGLGLVFQLYGYRDDDVLTRIAASVVADRMMSVTPAVMWHEYEGSGSHVIVVHAHSQLLETHCCSFQVGCTLVA